MGTVWIRVDTRLTTWYEILFWWEIRRIPYNILLGTLSLLLFLSNSGVSSFFKAAPRGDYLLWAALFWMIGNLYYTGSWVFHLISHFYGNSWMQSVLPRLMDHMLLISATISCIPLVFSTLNGLLHNSWSLPSHEMVYVKPPISQLTGIYHMSQVTQSQIEWTSPPVATRLVLYENGRFEVFGYPYVTYQKGNLKYESGHGTGEWKLSSNENLKRPTWKLTLFLSSLVHDSENFQWDDFQESYALNGDSDYDLLEEGQGFERVQKRWIKNTD